MNWLPTVKSMKVVAEKESSRFFTLLLGRQAVDQLVAALAR